MIKEEVIEFLARRFPTDKDNNWLTGNCYYFALILKERFQGEIYYDVIKGHFITKIEDSFYDYTGVYSEEECSHFIKWSEFESYDNKQLKRVINSCIK